MLADIIGVSTFLVMDLSPTTQQVCCGAFPVIWRLFYPCQILKIKTLMAHMNFNRTDGNVTGWIVAECPPF